MSASFNSPDEKARYVNSMFARIAGGYDRMNRVMSFGRDLAWRRRAIQLAAVPSGGRLLDVAVGTGDLALASIELQPSVRVTGVDFTLEMMHWGQQKELARAGSTALQNGDFSQEYSVEDDGTPSPPSPIEWTAGDALRLPYPDETFDAAVSGFMMRNVTDIAGAFAEQRRVVRPGGRVVCLEITRPDLPLWRDMYRWIFGHVMPFLTGVLSGQPDAYHYLPASLNSFVKADELKLIMESVGLRGVGYQTMMLGTVAIHVGLR
jgi:demethylmenaquinone methyltransferase/2-methoxy-6-polyprenyl-1,4-benzoquinol methylase